MRYSVQHRNKDSQCPPFSVYKTLRFKLARLLLQLNFLMACKNCDVIPKFLQFKTQIFPKGTESVIKNALRKMLKVTIRNLRKNINHIEVQCYYVFQSLNEHLDSIVFHELLLQLHDRIEKQKKKTKSTHHKKLRSLIENQKKASAGNNYEYNIPFINLSEYQFNAAELKVLNKGPNFAVPSKINLPNIIPDIENVVNVFPVEHRTDIRNKFAFAVNKHNNFLNNSNNHNNSYFKTIKQLKHNDNIRFLQADKTNQLVAIDQDNFNNKVQQMISDLNCKVIDTDPTDKFITKISNFARDSQKTAPPAPFKFKVPFYPAAPKLFVKIKTHKPDLPLRPIVAKYTAPTFNLEEKLNKFLIPLIDNYEYDTKSALALIDETKDLIIPQNAILASFDVKSMYPNVPTDRALDLIMRQADKFPDIKPHKKFIAKSLKIVFSANYFIFNGIIYLQLTGCPMGSPLSLTLSSIIMQEVEKQTLKHNPYQPFFFRRYIDDYFIIWEHDRKDLDIFLENMNNVYPTIKLTSEIEKNKSIAFLDLKITRGYNNHLYFNIYRKPSYVPIPFNAISDHPFSSKKAYFRSHILRAKSHTTFDFQEKSELNYIRKLAIDAGFTKKWINDLIFNTLSPPHKLSSQLISTVNNNDPKTQRYTTPIPYSQHFCNIQKYARRKFNVKIPFARPRDTSSLIVNNKDFGLISGGVYRIEFFNKENNEYKIYIGQTCRKLSARINEHKKGRDNKYCGTAVKQFLNSNPEYTPKWDDVKILASPRDHQSLLIREAIEIFQNSDKCINAKDGSRLPEIWQSYLTKFT